VHGGSLCSSCLGVGRGRSEEKRREAEMLPCGLGRRPVADNWVLDGSRALACGAATRVAGERAWQKEKARLLSQPAQI
jgi:hypothetical protein